VVFVYEILVADSSAGVLPQVLKHYHAFM